MTRTLAKHERPFSGLTPLMERFVREYVRCGSAKRAAVLAGYSGRSAKQLGHSLLRLKHVQCDILDLRQAGQAPPKQLSAEWALRKLAEETADPNPRIRLAAIKAVVQAMGVSPRREEKPLECPECKRRPRLTTMSPDDLWMYVSTGLC